MDSRRVFDFLHARLSAGDAAILVTVIAVEGSSMRGPGAHMGVSADGSFSGSLSGGCIENAVVAEALEALVANTPRIVRFGAGSRFIDIKLPCGGGLDIHFQPLGCATLIKQCSAAITARAPFSLRLSRFDEDPKFLAGWNKTGYDPGCGVATIGHWPEPKLVIVGHGAAVPALTSLALQMDLSVEILSPDREILSSVEADNVTTHHLRSPDDTERLASDLWTAFVFLFHDHDWDIALIASALTRPHFYLGAMGGRKAHAFRTDALKKQGCSDAGIDSIHAPIGLFHSSRDPDTLALSTLSEVIKTYHETRFEDDTH